MVGLVLNPLVGRGAVVGRLLFVAVLVVATLAGTFRSGSAAGPPLYPDLRTAPPEDLYFDTETIGGQTHYVVRFDNTIENHGGRLEIYSGGRRVIYQRVYDRRVGGALARSIRVGSQLNYHPEHNHFHFENFASYQLLQRDQNGVYRATTRRGTKTSFCIIDLRRVRSDAPTTSQYDSCNNVVQGLSSGWGDVYYGGLPEQWVDLGTSPLPDGDYAIKSTADPKNRLKETNESNNVGMTYFAVRNGQITEGAVPPRCSVAPPSGPVGTEVTVTCTDFEGDETVDLHWGSVNTAPRLTTQAVDGTVTIPFVIPESTIENHYLIVKSQTNEKYVAATVFATTPSMALGERHGRVGSTLPISLRGFARQESVTIKFYRTARSATTIGTFTTSTLGSVDSGVTIPTATFGPHKVEAIGQLSGKKVSATFTVDPSLALYPAEGPAGATVRPSLRGFAAYEKVNLAVDGQPLRQVTASGTGSVTATASTAFVLPDDLTVGPHTIEAIGVTSGGSASAVFTVTAPVAAAAEPEPTEAAPTAPPTAVPTEMPTTDPATEPSATPTEAAPTEAAPEPPVITAAEVVSTGPTSVLIRTTGSGAATVRVDYGLDESYGLEAAVAVPEHGVAEVALEGLTPGTTYHYRVVASGPGGETAGADATFTTGS